VIIFAIPGNISVATGGGGGGGTPVPTFTMGLQDGNAVRDLIANASPGRAPKVHAALEVKTVPGLKSYNVTGTLPGMTDENILVLAHVDGYFEAGNDNASGMATMIGLAEYYAKQPKARRRRTMTFVATPGHHISSVGTQWIHDHQQPLLAKTVLAVNCQDTAVAQFSYFPARGAAIPFELVASNGMEPTWFGVNGSDALASIVVKSFALFGVPTHLKPHDDVPGELGPVQFDAPSFYLNGTPTYFHSNMDTPDVVPASGLQASTRAFAKIFDDVNKLERKDLMPRTAVTSTSREDR
jgi:peptidase M28-like protein